MKKTIKDNLYTQHDISYMSLDSMSYINNLYENYLINPSSISKEWKIIFENISKEYISKKDISKKESLSLIQGKQLSLDINKQYNVEHLIDSYRRYGHYLANINPLEKKNNIFIENLEITKHNLSTYDLESTFYYKNCFSNSRISLRKILIALKNIYCSDIGIEYMHLFEKNEILWIQQYLEVLHGKFNFSNIKKKSILYDLTSSYELEQYLGKTYIGQKRFSLSGGDSLIPMIKEIIYLCGQKEVKEIIIGMAHRGRINVLTNILGIDPNYLFTNGFNISEQFGDVRYHFGYSTNILTDNKNSVHVSLLFNPSHLEIVGPVVEGSVLSRLCNRNDLQNKNTVIPVIIHGDSAFSGQGVVMENFNLSQTRGYSTGGTIHIVINNQIGFTTHNKHDTRSTFYCTDIAKMIQSPVLHVNGNNPEASIFAIQFAFDFKMKFKKDIVIDLVCYRRYGHNEMDDPSITQPIMYKKIKKIPELYKIYSNNLINDNVITSKSMEEIIKNIRDKLDKSRMNKINTNIMEGRSFSKILSCSSFQLYLNNIKTSISKKIFDIIANDLNIIPKNFNLHPIVKRTFIERQNMSCGKIPINWGYAETLAYASILYDGYGVRLSGQDSGRGTFSHRHAIIYDCNTGESYIPLKKFSQCSTKPFIIIDSILSEEAVLAFEYGYSSTDKDFLVIWEAQFGDFSNCAQVVIDQFISSGEQKWGKLCSLVIFLPHGYEGQGPEHSSARLERFLLLCSKCNMQICSPTTPAQIFHLLRRQIMCKFRKPLIVITPKSLLRHTLAVSSIYELLNGKFRQIISEIDVNIEYNKVNRVILCYGKIYYDLLKNRNERNINNIAILRIEQLYPFPKQDMIRELQKFNMVTDIVFCQEEPYNQGAWIILHEKIKECLQDEQKLTYVGRSSSSSPAVGSYIIHIKQQQDIINEALLY